MDKHLPGIMTDECVLVCDEKSKMIYVNAQLIKLLGCDKARLESQYKNLLDNFIIDEDKENFFRLLEDKGAWGVFHICSCDQVIKTVLLKSEPAESGAGYYKICVYDISDLCSNDSEEKQHFKALLETITGGVVLMELADSINVLYASKGMYSIADVPTTQQAHDLAELFSNIFPEDYEESLTKLKEIVGTHNSMESIYRINSAKGVEYRNLRAVQIPYDRSKNPVFLAIVFDVTEMYKTRAELEDTSKKMNALINNIPAGIAILDVGKYMLPTFINDELFNILGYAKDELTSYKRDIREFFYGDDMQGFLEEIKESVKDRHVVDRVFRLQKKDGSICWCHGRCTVIDVSERRFSVFAIFMDVTKQRDMEQEIKLNEERLKLAFTLTDADIWEYDVEKDEIYAINNNDNFDFNIDEDVIHNPQERFIESGFINEQFKQELQDLFNMIKQGKPKGQTTLRVKSKDNPNKLIRVSFVCIFDQDGKPYKAIGITEDVKDAVDDESKFAREQEIFESIRHMDEIIAAIKVNFTKNTVEQYKASDSNLEKDFKNRKTWEDALEIGKGFVAFDEDRDGLEKTFVKSSLERNYQKGVNIFCYTYRRKDKDGKIAWTSCQASMVADPVSHDVYMFVYIKDMGWTKSIELFMDKNSEMAGSCGTYSMETSKAMADILINKYEDTKHFYLVMLKPWENDDVFEHMQKQARENVMYQTGRILKLFLDDKCLIGRTKENEFIIFLAMESNEEWFQKRLQMAIKIIQMPYPYMGENEHVSFLMGVCSEKRPKPDFERMMEQARQALKAAGQKMKLELSVYDDKMPSYAGKGKNPFSSSNDDKNKSDIFLECASMLLNENDLKAGINTVLKEIRSYFDADKAYILEVNEDEQSGNVVYECADRCVEKYKDNPVYKDMDFLPPFEEAYKSKEPIIIHDIAFLNDAYEHEMLDARGINSLYVVPFLISGRVIGFVAVENVKANENDVNLLFVLSYLVVSEITKSRLEANEKFLKYRDSLTGAYNRKGFARWIRTFKGEAVSTLGIVSADINGLKHINEEYGNDYGDRLIQSIARKFTKHFGAESVFRFSGDEFLVVCIDYTYDSFMEKVKDIIAEMDEDTPGSVSCGYTWANKDIDIKKLISHAEELVLLAKRKYYQDNEQSSKHSSPEIMANLLRAINNGEYQMYLQPKAKMSTGEICGAEALVRMHHPKEGVIYPGKFIPLLEKHNLVRYIDLFIFEEVLKVLDRWKKEGRKLVTISLNFSRTTLLEADLLSNMKKIQKKYDVDKKYVEIEITETVGDIEIEVIRGICDEIVKQGYRLSLDDFGSKYSSLYVLTAMKFDMVKIDKTLVNEVIGNEDNRTLLKGIFSICKNLGMECIAEGVETQQQFDMLGQLGCTYAQGYLFNKPIEWREFEKKYILKVES